MNNQILNFEVSQYKQFLTKAPVPALAQEAEPRWRTGKSHSLKRSIAAAPEQVFFSAGRMIITVQE